MEQLIRAAADAGLRSLPRRGAEIGGVLATSSPNSSALVIDSAELVETEHRYGPGYQLSPRDKIVLRSRIAELRARKSARVVGYFRSCTGSGFTFAPSDLELVRDELPECEFLLIVKPFPDGHADAKLFRQQAGSWTETVDFEFTHSAPWVPRSNSEWLAGSNEPPVNARVGRPRAVMLGAAVLSCVALFSAAAWLRTRPSEITGLGVVVQPAGELLRVTWGRDTQPVRTASGGLVRIQDGAEHREFALNPGELSSGSLLYRPASADVTFRLEVRTPERTVGESIHYVSGAPPVRNPVVAPAAIPSAVPPSLPATVRPPTRTAAPVESARKLAVPVTREKPVQEEEAATPREENRVPDRVPEVKAEPPLSTPVLVAQVPQEIQPRIETPPVPPPSAKTPAEMKKPWEPIRSVMHYLNDPAVIPPRPVQKVIPRTDGLTTFERQEISVLVAVDPKGKVAGAQLVNPAASVDPELARRALAAARHWKFEPAMDHGKIVRATYTVTFRFEAPNR